MVSVVVAVGVKENAETCEIVCTPKYWTYTQNKARNKEQTHGTGNNLKDKETDKETIPDKVLYTAAAATFSHTEVSPVFGVPESKAVTEERLTFAMDSELDHYFPVVNTKWLLGERERDLSECVCVC